MAHALTHAHGTRVSEEEAVQLALHGTALERLRVGVNAIANLMRDPEDTREAFVLAAVLDRDRIAKPFFHFMIDPTGFELMRDQPAIDSNATDYDALAALPRGTLGHAYVNHLRERGLDPDLFQAPPGAPPGISYFAQRLRQTHDIWHVLTGYQTDIAGEVALQGFVFGQLGTPTPVVTAIAGAIRCGKGGPRAALDAWAAYWRGKRARFLMPIRWEDHWAEPLDQLRARLGILPLGTRS